MFEFIFHFQMTCKGNASLYFIFPNARFHTFLVVLGFGQMSVNLTLQVSKFTTERLLFVKRVLAVFSEKTFFECTAFTFLVSKITENVFKNI